MDSWNAMSSKSASREFFILLLTLFALGFLLRVWGLDRDPPSIDVLPDEAPWTDEGTLALPALELVRGAQSLTDGATLLAGVHPLYQATLYGTFQLFGPGRLQGRLFSVLAGMLGLVALARLGGMLWPRSGTLLALALGATGFFLVVFDRSILTEGPLAAGLTIVAWLGLSARSARGAWAVGAAIGLLAVGLKLHALAMLPAFGVLYLLRYRRLLIPLIVGFAMVVLAWRALWIPVVPSYSGYIGQRLTEQNMGIADPLQVIIQLFLAGLPGYFFPYQIALLFLTGLEAVALMLAPRRWLGQAPDLLVVASVWLVAALAGASLFKYMPARYYLTAVPPLILLAIAGVKRLLYGTPFPLASKPLRWTVGLVLGLFLLFQVAPPLPLFGEWALVIPVLGIPAPFLVYWITSRTRPGWEWPQRTRLALLAGLLSFHFLFQAGLYWAGVVQSRPDLAHVAATLTGMLPPDAIVTGRLAGTIALMSPLRGEHQYKWVDRSFLDSLRRDGPVWLLVLQGDEKFIEPKVRAGAIPSARFPVGYSQKVRDLQVLEYVPE